MVLFIGITLYLSFANEEPEVKIVGLTFFISLFFIGPFFAGIISIPAPIPMDSDNSIEIVSVAISAVISAIALGIYKIYEAI